MEPHNSRARGIAERIIFRGDLILTTPVSLGGENNTSLVDLPLTRDPLEGKALLTGASLAGALRNYLRERELGFRVTGSPTALESALFGYQKGKKGEYGEDPEADEGNEGDEGDKGEARGEQSYIIVSDAIGDIPATEIRDGVAIDPRTRTAEPRKKFDYDVLEAGARFPLRLELLLPAAEDKRLPLVRALAIALQGLERGEIRIGGRKRRGFGCCFVPEWTIVQNNLLTPQGLVDWVTNSEAGARRGQSAGQLLGMDPQDLAVDNRSLFQLNAEFSIEGSLLIRSGSTEGNAPDAIHLRSRRNGSQVPVLSGTALAGALRARAVRICSTIGSPTAGEILVSGLFGPKIRSRADAPRASKFVTLETEINHSLDLVQNRIKIDRFTGGAFPGALFNEQPVYGQAETTTSVQIRIENPTGAEIGLLLLLLKDLWTSDLPLGGGASVGRGRLRGKRAALQYQDTEWTITQEGADLALSGNAEELEAFVHQFVEEMSI